MLNRYSLVVGLAVLALVAAGCDGGSSMKPAGSGGKKVGGPVTGLLIVAQTPEGESVDVAHETVVDWKLVDSLGTRIFGKSDINPSFLKQKGVKYEWHRAKALEGSSMWLGKNYLEVPVSNVNLTGEEKKQTAVLTVSGATAEELKALPNLDTLVSRCMIVMLLGKIGG
jgi:hypothetical protein